MTKPKPKTKLKPVRTVLVMLTNRVNRNQRPRCFELSCKPNGPILKERLLRRQPAKASYDEIWTNDEGRQSIDDCTRMVRVYKHPLLRRKDG